MPHLTPRRPSFRPATHTHARTHALSRPPPRSEFIPLALNVFESLYAKTELHRQQEAAFSMAEDMLLHGLTREELEATLHEVFAQADQNGDGTLSRVEFRTVLKEAGMGFTRKELNAIMHEVDVNGDGVISYKEFVPVAMALCRDVLAREIVAGKLPAKEAEAAEFLMALFEAADSSANGDAATGFLPQADLQQLLASADLGLSTVQLNAIVSEARADDQGMVAYQDFAVSAATMFSKIFDFRVAENDAV